MRNGRLGQRQAVHITASAFGCLTDRIRDAARLAHANADLSSVITYNDHRAEGEASATFDHLGDAGDVNYALIKLIALFFTFASRFSSSHGYLH
jgi:hypothetical protein